MTLLLIIVIIYSYWWFEMYLLVFDLVNDEFFTHISQKKPVTLLRRMPKVINRIQGQSASSVLWSHIGDNRVFAIIQNKAHIYRGRCECSRKRIGFCWMCYNLLGRDDRMILGFVNMDGFYIWNFFSRLRIKIIRLIVAKFSGHCTICGSIPFQPIFCRTKDGT